MTLNQLPEGETARIESLGMEGRLRRRLMDIGMIPGTRWNAWNGAVRRPRRFSCARNGHGVQVFRSGNDYR